MASFHSGTDKIVFGECTRFDNSDRTRWKYADF